MAIGMLWLVANLLNQREKLIITHVLLKDGTDGSFDGDFEVGDLVTVRLNDEDGLPRREIEFFTLRGLDAQPMQLSILIDL